MHSMDVRVRAGDDEMFVWSFVFIILMRCLCICVYIVIERRGPVYKVGLS